MVAPVLIVGFVFGFVKRGWLVVPAAAAFLPAVLVLAGAFDDGEGVGTMWLLGLVFAGYAAIGLLGSLGLQRIASQPRSASNPAGNGT